MLKRFIATGFLMIAFSVRVATYGQTNPSTTSSDLKVGDTTYKIVDRTVLPKAIVFHEFEEAKDQPCLIVGDPQKNCGVLGGVPAYGILGCGGGVLSGPEKVRKTFARVPGRDAPNLFAFIVDIHRAKKTDEGELVIAVLACGSRVAIPIVQEGPFENQSSYKFNRLSFRILSSRRFAQITLQGIEKRPDTFRIAGMNEAVLYIVPFKALDDLKIENEPVTGEPQTRSVDLADGKFALGSHSAGAHLLSVNVEREIVPAGHPAVRVIDGPR